jgi:hypothetical protein
MDMTLTTATSADVAALFEMLLALGVDDGVADVRTTPQPLHDALFGATPVAFAHLIPGRAGIRPTR